MEGGMVFPGRNDRHDLLAGIGDEPLDAQALFAGRSAAKTAAGRRVGVLEAFHGKRLQESCPEPPTF
jgi:hypothetical protein